MLSRCCSAMVTTIWIFSGNHLICTVCCAHHSATTNQIVVALNASSLFLQMSVHLSCLAVTQTIWLFAAHSKYSSPPGTFWPCWTWVLECSSPLFVHQGFICQRVTYCVVMWCAQEGSKQQYARQRNDLHCACAVPP